jgi:hypothetical protein
MGKKNLGMCVATPQEIQDLTKAHKTDFASSKEVQRNQL